MKRQPFVLPIVLVFFMALGLHKPDGSYPSTAGTDISFSFPDNQSDANLNTSLYELNHNDLSVKIDRIGSSNRLPTTPVASQWLRTYGETGYHNLLSVRETGDGGYIAAGWVTTTGTSNLDAWVVKLDVSGAILWQRKYGNTYSLDDLATDIQPIENGGYIVSGATEESGIYNIWVLELSSSGEIVWQKQYYHSYGQLSPQLAVTPTGEYVLVENTWVSSTASVSLLVIKLDKLGNILWQNELADSGFLGPGQTRGLQATPDGGIVIADVHNTSDATGNDVRVLKLDSNGNVYWHRTYHALGDESPRYLIQDSDGGLIVAGVTSPFGGGPTDIWVLKLDSVGEIVWANAYSGQDYDSPIMVQPAIGGGYIIVGYTRSFGSGVGDGLVLRLDETGSIVWQRTYGGPRNDSFTSVRQTMDGGYIVSGATESYGGVQQAALLLKIDRYGEAAGCSVMTTSNLTVIPTAVEVLTSIVDAQPSNFIPQNAAAQPRSVYYEPFEVCGDNTIDVSGTITDGHGHPLEGIIVGLAAEQGESELLATTTNEAGTYVLSGGLGSGSFTIAATLQTTNYKNSVVWGPNRILTAVETLPFTPDGTLTIKDVAFGDATLNSSPIPAEVTDDLAAMYYHTWQVENFVRNDLGVVNYEPVSSIWGFAPLTTGAFYSKTTKSITIGAGISAYAIDLNDNNRPMNREWHENFHHLMNVTLGMPPFAGGEYNHVGFPDNPTTDDSWTEGWAEFWSCVLWDSLGFPNPQLYRLNDGAISLELNWQVWDGYPGASREEFAVASLLWDLYDPKVSNDVDNVDLSLATLWHVLGQATTDNALSNMRDVYLVLTEADLTNEDGTTVSKSAIDSLFVVHGFFADDGNHLWNPGEEPGWGGRVGRPNTPTIKNAYLKVNVQNEDGLPVDDAQLMIDVHFANSYYDYSYTVELASGIGSLVYLEPPPSRVPTTVEIVAANGGGRSNTYMLNSVDYWNAVANTQTGYAEEVTFELAYLIHLPFVSGN